MKINPSHRYAVYFAGDPQGDFWLQGSRWLGRDATGSPIKELPSHLELDPQVHQKMTTHPRRYGWHATLKAPFSLKEQASLNDLDLAMEELAKSLFVFDLPALVVKEMKNFLALAPIESTQLCKELKLSASKCVETLHHLARPLNESEIAYRKSAQLSSSEEAMMLKWGYPFVHELFEFHFTLSNALENFEGHQVRSLTEAAHQWFAAETKLSFDRISLFVEPTPGSEFKWIKDYCIPS